MQELLQKIDSIRKLLIDQVAVQKRILNLEEAGRFLGISKSDLYKRTSSNSIPFHKPSGKLIYFLREDLESWMLKNRQSTIEEIKDQSSKFKLGGAKDGK